jgi:hypothetical protein
LFDKILLDAKTPWKISDLITVGSPLTHAPLLFAESTEDFERLKEQRELPTCPPERDYGSPYCGWEVEGENRFELHHAAPFAVVQWTNCYFDSDPVGGPLGPVLGCGMRDLQLPLPVPNKPSWRDHVRYWSMGPDCGGNTFSEEIHKLILDN